MVDMIDGNEIELQDICRSFSQGEIKYLVQDDTGFSQTQKYLLSEEGVKGWYLHEASREQVLEWCQKDTNNRMVENSN